MEKNREEEQRLRKDKTRMESTLNATIAKYDEDMASRSKTLQVREAVRYRIIETRLTLTVFLLLIL